ncbi:MAG: peroxiredoxin [Haloarculaceae archaeon]
MPSASGWATARTCPTCARSTGRNERRRRSRRRPPVGSAASGGPSTLAARVAVVPLDPGDPAPDVTATDQHGESVAPDFEGTTVVYFYIEGDTPGRTTQAEQFGLETDVYEGAGVTVYGVSTDDVDSHREFAAERTTFVVEDGEVVRTHEGVSPDSHARDLLMDLYDSRVVDLET